MKKETKNLQIQIKKSKHFAFEADQKVEVLSLKLNKAELSLGEAKENFSIACKRRLGPEK